MAPSVRLVKSKESLSRDELADLLEGLAARIRTGEVRLKSGDEEVVLTLPDRVTVEVEATRAERRRGTKMELEVEIEWYDGQAATDTGLQLG